MRFMKNTMLVFLTFMFSHPAIASQSCLTLFRNQMKERITYSERQALIRSLNRSDLGCLYHEAAVEAESLPTPNVSFNDFFNEYPSEAPRVEKFYGKSSLMVSQYFEKHFFYITTNGERKLYAYNHSESGDWLGGPGFLAVTVSPSHHFFEGDYTRDFVNEIPANQFLALSGRVTSKIQNNNGNMIYGNLMDHFYLIHPDVLINEGRRRSSFSDQKTTHEVYFILLREPN